MNLQQMIATLDDFWSKQGALIAQPYGIEVGAGTANPMTFLRVLGPEPFNVAYVEPSRRPQDGRYGLSPNRFQHYFQYQVILKPAPAFNQELYLDLLKQLGLDHTKHDIRFVEDNWESAPIGAWGLGWEIWCDGMEITQYTYFQQVAGVPLEVPALEITFGLERMAMYIQGVDDYHDLKWNDTLTVSDLFEQHEFWQSKHNYETANIQSTQQHFKLYEQDVKDHLQIKNYWAAYDYLLKMSHTFNILDARGVVSLADRTARFADMGKYAKEVGKQYLEERKELKYPFAKKIRPFKTTLPTETPKVEVPKALNEKNVYILELGFEEMPANFMQKWIKAISAGNTYGNTNSWLELQLAEYSWSFEKAYLLFTPRRVVIRLDEPMILQEKTTILKGPRKDIAYDANGQPTAVLEGFMRKNNLKEKDISSAEYNGMELVVAHRAESIKLAEVIQEIINRLMRTAPAGRWMRWDENPKHLFIRPLRWIVSYYSKQTIPVTLFDLTPSGYTLPPRYVANAEIKVSSAQEYLSYIQSTGIELDHLQRRNDLVKGMYGSESHKEEPLVWENVFLTETLSTAQKDVANKYKTLPTSVIQKILEKNQRYITSHGGEYFIVMNRPKSSKSIADSNEAVVKARLEDGLFYQKQDLQKKLNDWHEELKRVAFHPKAGSMYDKAGRVMALHSWFKNNISSVQYKTEEVDKALEVYKNGRATNLGKEFPELEFAISAHYAELEKYPAQSVKVLKQLGKTTGLSNEALIITLLDCIDTFVTMAAVDKLPDGSHDPYQLRQYVYTILELFEVYAKELYDVDLEPLLEAAYGLAQTYDHVTQLDDIKQFITMRLMQKYRLQTKHDWVVYAVALAKHWRLAHKEKMLSDLNKLNNTELVKLFDTLKRVHNVLKQIAEKGVVTTDQTVDRKLLQTDSERKVVEILKSATPVTLEEVQQFITVIDQFFAENMIMDKDPAIQKNRAIIVSELSALLTRNLNYQP